MTDLMKQLNKLTDDNSVSAYEARRSAFFCRFGFTRLEKLTKCRSIPEAVALL